MGHVIGLVCEMCEKDPEVVCKRDADAECLICGSYLCGGHIAEHLSSQHCVSLSLAHCRKQEAEYHTYYLIDLSKVDGHLYWRWTGYEPWTEVTNIKLFLENHYPPEWQRKIRTELNLPE